MRREVNGACCRAWPRRLCSSDTMTCSQANRTAACMYVLPWGETPSPGEPVGLNPTAPRLFRGGT